MKVVDGELKEGMRLCAHSQPKGTYDCQEVGVLLPNRVQTGSLCAGQVGYVIAGMKSTKEARVGDTLCCTSTITAVGGDCRSSDQVSCCTSEQVALRSRTPSY